jgi:hypothetical protein
MAKAIDKKKIAAGLFKAYPEQNKAWITDDGQGFFKENYAKNNASEKGLEDPEVFFREGYQSEDNQDLEEALQETEETVKEQEIVLNTVIDVANIEAEETPEVSENAHVAVKAVAELRAKYEANIEQTNSFKEEIKEELDFNAAVVELIKNDTTKLADAIRTLIPTKE